MDINWDQWKFWLDFVQWIAMLALSIWVFIDKGRSKNSQAIQNLTDSHQSVDRRVVKLENEAATHKDVAKLAAEMEGLKSTLTRLTVTTDRIHDYLLNNKESK